MNVRSVLVSFATATIVLLGADRAIAEELWVARKSLSASGATRLDAWDRQQQLAAGAIGVWQRAIERAGGATLGTNVDLDSSERVAGRLYRNFTVSVLYSSSTPLDGSRRMEGAELTLSTDIQRARVRLTPTDLTDLVAGAPAAGFASRMRRAWNRPGSPERAWVWGEAGGDMVGFRLPPLTFEASSPRSDTPGFHLSEASESAVSLRPIVARGLAIEKVEGILDQTRDELAGSGATVLATGVVPVISADPVKRHALGAVLSHGTPTDTATPVPAHTIVTIRLRAVRDSDLIGVGLARLSLADILALHGADATATTAAAVLERAWQDALAGTPDAPEIALTHTARVDGSEVVLALEGLDIARVLGREPGGALRNLGLSLGLTDPLPRPAELPDDLAEQLSDALRAAPRLDAETRDRLIALRSGPAAAALAPDGRAVVAVAVAAPRSDTARPRGDASGIEDALLGTTGDAPRGDDRNPGADSLQDLNTAGRELVESLESLQRSLEHLNDVLSQ